MNFLKKKTEEAKKAANRLSAQASNKAKTKTFSGPGYSMQDASQASVATQPPKSSSKATKASKVPPISEEERQLRREQQARMAEERSKSWDKRIADNKKKNPRKPPPDWAYGDNLNASSVNGDNGREDDLPSATAKLSMDEVKKAELEYASEAGFNPYQTTYSSSGQARRAMNAMGEASSEMPNSNETKEGASLWIESERGESGLQRLIHEDPLRATIAIQTISKMLKNILANPQEEKFRRIRVGNAAFQNKVGKVDGGIETFLMAGFVVENGADQHSEVESVAKAEEDAFLVLHNLDETRIQDVLDQMEAALVALT